MAVILIILLKNKLQDFPPIAGHRVRKFITIGQENNLSPSCQIHEKPTWDFTISQSHSNYRMSWLCYHTQNKANKTIHRPPLKKTMFYIIKELYVLSVMQIIFHQATTMMAGIFNKHFYRHFYGSEVWCTIWKLQIIQFSQLFTIRFALFQRMHAFFKKSVFFPQPVQFSAGLISISIPRLITNERALQL